MNFKTFVNEKKGVVVVRATDAMDELFREARDFMLRYQVPCYNVLLDFLDEHKYVLNKLSGTAKCNFDAGDTFNADFGEKLAKAKLMRKFEGYRHKMYALLAHKVHTVYCEVYDRMNRSWDRLDSRDAKVDSLVMTGKSIY